MIYNSIASKYYFRQSPRCSGMISEMLTALTGYLSTALAFVIKTTVCWDKHTCHTVSRWLVKIVSRMNISHVMHVANVVPMDLSMTLTGSMHAADKVVCQTTY